MIRLHVTKRDPQKESNDYLRSQGNIPAVMYGPEFESTPITISDSEFRKVFNRAGTSSVITTTGDIEGEMVLIQDMQTHVVTGHILSVDFKVVNKGETTEVTVPFSFEGEAPAVRDNKGLLNIVREDIVVETVPSKIPQEIVVNIENLNEVGDSIKLEDIQLPEGVSFVEDGDTVIVAIGSLQE